MRTPIPLRGGVVMFFVTGGGFAGLGRPVPAPVMDRPRAAAQPLAVMDLGALGDWSRRADRGPI